MFSAEEDADYQYFVKNSKGIICIDYAPNVKNGSIVASTQDDKLRFISRPNVMRSNAGSKDLFIHELTTYFRKDSYTCAIAKKRFPK